MKKRMFPFIISFLTLINVSAQVPKSFKYQAVVRDASNKVITNQNVSFQINIIQDTTTGLIVYTETHSGVKTNGYGLVNIYIGRGTAQYGKFNTLDWSKYNYYLGINMDANGGSNYSPMGITELLSVPYALYAASAGNSGGTNLNLTGTGSTTVTGTYPNYNINGSYQYLKSSNDTIYLTNGGFVKLPYSAGTGIGITGTNIINTMPNATHTGDAIGSWNLTVIAIQGNAISTTIPSTNQALRWNGTAWSPTNISENTYNAGNGLTLTGKTFLNTSPNLNHTGDAIGSGSLTVIAIQGNAVSTTMPTSGQSLVWNGTNWLPSTISSSTYNAGTGLTLTGNTFSNTGVTSVSSGTGISVSSGTGSIIITNISPNNTHTGDAIGSGALSVVAIQGKAISTNTPVINQLLSWNGSAWTPSTVNINTYNAGNGLSLTGSTFTNTSPNATHTGDVTGSGALTVVAIQGNPVSSNSPSFNQGLRWNGSSWTPTVISENTYYAGSGLSQTGNTFNNTGVTSVIAGTGISVSSGTGTVTINNANPNITHSGDATGSGALTVIAIQGKAISTIMPSSGQSLVWSGSAWAPTANAGQAYYAGIGISLTGYTFNNTSQNATHTGDVIGSGAITVVAIQGNSISTNTPSANQGLRWNGTNWNPSNISENTYYAGNGLSLSGGTFTNSSPNFTHTGDATGSGALTVVALQGNAITTTLPSNGQSLIWNGSSWSPTTITNNTYYAGTGLALTGNTFTNSSPNITHTGDATGSGALTVVALQGNAITTTLPSNGQSLIWNGSSWSPTTITNNTYYAGTGLALTGNTFTNSSPNITHTGDATGSWALTVVAIQGNAVTTTLPSNGQSLNWNGSAWSPSTIINNTYYAGTGLALTGNTFTNSSPNITHTGDATGSGALTVVAIQGNAVTTTLPSNGQSLVWNGSSWSPYSLSSNTYYAGTGLSMTGNTFYHLAHTGDAIGQTNITVVALQGKPISSSSLLTFQMLTWNGLTWAPSYLNIPNQAAGDILYYDGSNWVRLPKGNNGQFLTIQNNKPSWRTTHYIGEYFGGGIVFHVDSNGLHGLIVAPQDQNNGIKIQWGCNGYAVGSSAQSLTNGTANTSAIVAFCPFKPYAASICDTLTLNGYTDWYLPSKNELNLLYLQKNVVNNFVADRYWSSTENDLNTAWYEDMSTGYQNCVSNKSSTYYLRAIRSF